MKIKKKMNIPYYIKYIDVFIEIHQKMIKDIKENIKSIDPIVTLRNYKILLLPK